MFLSLHDRLCAMFPWYKRWHDDKYSTAILWILFIAFALFFALMVITTIQTSMYELESQAPIVMTRTATTQRQQPAPVYDVSKAAERIKTLNTQVADLLGATKGPLDENALRNLLTTRMNVLYQFVYQAPGDMAQVALASTVRTAIPTSLQALVESPTSKTGTFLVTTVKARVTNGIQIAESSVFLLKVSDTKSYRMLVTPDQISGIQSGQKVVVKGYLIKDSVLVSTEAIKVAK